MSEPREEHRRKAKAKGSQSALKGNWEIACNAKRRGSVRGETLAVSATMRENVGKERVIPVPFQIADEQRWKNFCSKGRPTRGGCQSRKRLQKPCKDHLK